MGQVPPFPPTLEFRKHEGNLKPWSPPLELSPRQRLNRRLCKFLIMYEIDSTGTDT